MIPLTDNPVGRLDDDAFGFATHVRELHQAVLAATPLPLTVGVYGGWGTGKSSFLGMWQDLLKRESPDGTRTMWFNPWKYDRKVEVWAALLHSMLAEIQGSVSAKDKVRELARTVGWLSVRASLGYAASWATAGLVGKAEVAEVMAALDRGTEQFHEVNAFEEQFAEAVNSALGPDGRMVVFIDDLDRCTPDAAIAVLEALKLFIGHARCVFVLGLDVDVLTAVSTNKFAGALASAPEASVSGRRYLEKIVQLPFFLPEVPLSAVRSMLRSHVSVVGDSDAFWELIEVGLGTNPRRVKRFVNVLELAASIQRDLYADPKRKLQLVKLLILRSEHRSFFHRLTREPSAWQAVEEHPDGIDAALFDLMKLSPKHAPYNDHPPAPDADEVRKMLDALPPEDGKVHEITESSA